VSIVSPATASHMVAGVIVFRLVSARVERIPPRYECRGIIHWLLYPLALLSLIGCQAMQYPSPKLPERAASKPHTAPKRTLPHPAHPRHQPLGNLVGLDENQIKSTLGSPDSQEERGPGHRWIYRSGKCTLSLSLYPDISTRVFRSLSYEVSTDDRSEQGKRLCTAELENRSVSADAKRPGKN